MGSVESYGCKHMIATKGVGIGSNRKLTRKLGASAKISLKQLWTSAGVFDHMTVDDNISDMCTPLRSAVWRAEVYRPGDHVVVLVDGSIDTTHPQNWKAVIRQIFMHEFGGHMDLFFEADWYKQRYEEERHVQS